MQIQHRIDHPTESQKQEPSVANIEKKINGSGTGFIITKDGYVLTCHHVIKGATKIEIALEGKTYPATLVRDDPNNDLALLKINGFFPAIAFSSDRSAKMGQEVFTIGYPNPDLQGVSAKYTEGTINSLTGFQDDIRLYQISIPVQPGNSGGALLDENGNILGIVMAMLDAKTTFKITGSLPQNVNYAVKSVYAQALLDTLPEVVGKLSSAAKTKSDAISNAEKSTVMVVCYD
nr:trypsin-like peptidase domain-containing protein [Desulfobacula sp.]